MRQLKRKELFKESVLYLLFYCTLAFVFQNLSNSSGCYGCGNRLQIVGTIYEGTRHTIVALLAPILVLLDGQPIKSLAIFFGLNIGILSCYLIFLLTKNHLLNHQKHKTIVCYLGSIWASYITVKVIENAFYVHSYALKPYPDIITSCLVIGTSIVFLKWKKPNFKAEFLLQLLLNSLLAIIVIMAAQSVFAYSERKYYIFENIFSEYATFTAFIYVFWFLYNLLDRELKS